MEPENLKAAEEGVFVKEEGDKDVVIKPMPKLDYEKKSLKDRFYGLDDDTFSWLIREFTSLFFV